MASSETPSCHLRPLLTEKVRDEKADKGGKKGKKKKNLFQTRRLNSAAASDRNRNQFKAEQSSFITYKWLK